MAANSTVSLSIKFERETVLGKGGYGTVFRGEWNNKRVAVKRIELAKCEAKKEEEALKWLDHPNVVKLFHIDTYDSFRMYALEFCQASLDQKFLNETNPRKYRGPMPPDEEVCLQLAKGLAHIHENRLIHRDLKPENVLIQEDSTGKVLMKWADFGLSKTVNERGSHSISGMRGTNNWHSPEILKIMMEENDCKTTTATPNIGPRGTVKSDVYTAGLVFGYYLLGGDHPFGSPINVLPNIFKNEPVNLPKIKDPSMHAIIMDMLQGNPDERISSADVVSRLNNLIEFQLHESVSLRIKFDRNAVLGRGYYGIVFKGEWNNKIVAVKRIVLAQCENNEREKEALKGLDHPNVVKLYHVEKDDDFRYYALELCQLSMDQLFKGNETQKKYRQKMPPEEEVCLQLAKGLAHIHEKQLIHRDIKPHNVLIWVDSTGEKVLMKWADFGLSKKVNERGSHSISGMRGTHNWHSPEILKIFISEEEKNDGKPTTTTPDIRPRGTVKSDVFSAGLVFGYYLLGGDHPFGSGSEKSIEENIVNNKPVNMTKIKLHPMHAIIMEMLKDNPNERISSAEVVSRINILIELQSRIWRLVPVKTAANANLGTVSIENDTRWDELIAPAPMGIAVMSQLLICASRVRDSSIDISDTTHIPLMKHPDSFRKTLVQITDECYDAFMKAHINMYKIQLKMEQVPDYIKDCIKSMPSGNQSDKQNLLMPKRLDRIKEVATDGQVLSKEVCDTFDRLGQLIRQFITASVKTMGDHEIADTIAGEKKSEREIERANATVREKQNYLDGIRERKWDFWLQRIGCESKDKSLEHGRKMKEEAENKLKELKAEKEVCEKEINQMLKDNIERLEKMGIDANNEISPKQAIETLKEGLGYLDELQKQWASITLCFNKIKIHLTETTAKNLEDFIDNAEVAQEGSEEYELVMPDSIKESLQSPHKTHHSAKMYVKVSNNYIIKSINQMYGMLALPTNEIEEAQNKLVASCEAAANGIKNMYTEDKK